MTNIQSSTQLDLVFKALSDQTRRAQLDRLIQGPASISELAAPFAMSLPAASKHIKVLQKANLISCKKNGRVHICEIEPTAFVELDRWMATHRQFWNDKFDQLEVFLQEKPASE